MTCWTTRCRTDGDRLRADELEGPAVQHRHLLAAGLGDPPPQQVVVQDHQVGALGAGLLDGVGDELVDVHLGVAEHRARAEAAHRGDPRVGRHQQAHALGVDGLAVSDVPATRRGRLDDHLGVVQPGGEVDRTVVGVVVDGVDDVGLDRRGRRRSGRR